MTASDVNRLKAAHHTAHRRRRILGITSQARTEGGQGAMPPNYG